mgnify:CR=1 FL=1
MLKNHLKYRLDNSMLKSLVVPMVCIVFIVSLMIFSKTAVNSALKGIDLWLNVVFPSLFPFLVASEVLSGTNFIKAVGILLEPIMRPLFNVPGCASFPIAIGITSGYPVGAKVIVSLKENKLINKKEAERLLAFCNNSSPLFITGAVSVGMLKLPKIGPLLLLCHVAAGISVGLIFKYFYSDCYKANWSFPKAKEKFSRHNTSSHISSSNNSPTNFVSLLGNAVKNSVISLLAIGGFIILFSVIINILIESGIISSFVNFLYLVLKYTCLPKELFVSLSGGFIEITTGLKMLSSLENISLNVRLIAASIIIGWGGISVHMQILSIVNNSGLSIKPYLIGKLMQSIIAAFYTLIMINITRNVSQPTAVIFRYLNISVQEPATWSQFLLISCKQLSLTLLLFVLLIVIAIIISLLSNQLNKLFISSKKMKTQRRIT